MTDRQRFWLKVAAAVTAPLWFVLLVPVAIVYLVCAGCWLFACSIVEPTPRYPSGKQAP